MVQTAVELLDTTECSTLANPVCTSGLFNVNGQVLVLVCPTTYLAFCHDFNAEGGQQFAAIGGLEEGEGCFTAVSQILLGLCCDKQCMLSHFLASCRSGFLRSGTSAGHCCAP